MPPAITASTTLCAVIGNPVGHSLSPDIHNAAFRHLGLDWVYTAFRVENLAPAIAGVRALGIRGVSITIPHKVAALPLLDSMEETAAKIGAVNTIVNAGGRLHGINTDGAGALRALTGAGHDPAGASVLILGSGGAARAIAFTLAVHAAPARLAIAGIVPGELATLCADIAAATPVSPVPVAMTAATLREAVAGARIIINCTPLGMHPQAEASPLPAELLGSGQVVFDIVYNPLMTRLLKDARARGAAVICGIEMFLNQACLQFEHWTGLPAPAEVMREVLMKKFSA
jgi:shikimate dehydrogenase